VGTVDEYVFQQVFHCNEYELPHALASSDIVIDVGAHIGCYALAAAFRGSRRVVGIEANGANFALAAINLKHRIESGAIRLILGAVWRSDANDDTLRCEPFPHLDTLINTGGSGVLPGPGNSAAVPKLALDELLVEETRGGTERVRFLKLDCEGSEWPILLTASRLDLVDEIVGEFHEFGGEHDGLQTPYRIAGCDRFTSDMLKDVLERAGFAVEIRRNQVARRLGLFFARR
jgi:FkbM family methyltransferase